MKLRINTDSVLVLIPSLLLILFMTCFGEIGYCQGVDQWSRVFDGVLNGHRMGLFLGGLEHPTITLADIDADGDQDLFLGDWSGKVVFAENVGTPEAAAWHFVTDFYAGIDTDYNGEPGPSDVVGVEFVDIDGDEDLDLFTFTPITYFWENIGNMYQPEWDSVGLLDSLISSNGGLCFFDADRDGDLDVFGGVIGGYWDGQLMFYRNVGDSLNPFFRLEDTFYDSIYVGNNGSRPRLADIDADGDDDLFIANGARLYFYRNQGLPDSADFVFETDEYLLGRSGYSFEFADIDGDSDLDYFMLGSYGCGMYENIGTPEEAEFVDRSDRDFCYFDQGSFTSIICADIDYDGKVEILHTAAIGNFLLESEGDYPNRRWSITDSSFVLPGSRFGEYYDLDSDGDLDFIYPNGRYIGYLKNIGDSSEYIWDDSDSLYLYMGNGPSDHSASPQVVDFDNDGDGDIVSGQAGSAFGYVGLTYFRNIGTPTEPEFERVTNKFGGLYIQSAYVTPTVGDIDLDGDKDVIVGVWRRYVRPFEGTLWIYENVGTDEAPDFQLAVDGLRDEDIETPHLWDYDNDGDLDCIAAGLGGMCLFINETIPTTSVPEGGGSGNLPRDFTLLQNYPNPFNSSTNIRYRLPERARVTLDVYNLVGQMVATLVDEDRTAGYHTVKWDARDYSSGIYFYKLTAGDEMIAKRMVLLK